MAIIPKAQRMDGPSRNVYVTGGGEESPINVGLKDQLIDAFGRVRVSNPVTVFDSQMQYDKQPFLWAEKTSGTATLTHVPDESSLNMTLGTASGDLAIRQTREYHRYQPGKSQYIKCTGTFGAAQAGTQKLVGYGDDNNGVFFGQDGGGMFALLRSNTTGTPSDARKVYQADWNLDPVDGSADSKMTLDQTNAQIMLFDIEWLGAGRVRMGLISGGEIVFVHDFLNANLNPTTYMTTANLPVRYEIRNTEAVSSAPTLKQICTEVESEGGQQNSLAFPFSADLQDVPIPNGAGNASVVFAARHQLTFNSIENRGRFGPINYTLLASGGGVYTRVLYNPTITGGTWLNTIPESIMESNATATGFSGGVQIASAQAASSGIGNPAPGVGGGDISSKLPFGLDVDAANPITLALIAWADSNGVTASFTFNWEELR